MVIVCLEDSTTLQVLLKVFGVRRRGMTEIQVLIQALMKTGVYVEEKGIRDSYISAIIHNGGKLNKDISCLSTFLLI